MGSNPTRCTNGCACSVGTQGDCKSPAFGIGGSIPHTSTIFARVVQLAGDASFRAMTVWVRIPLRAPSSGRPIGRSRHAKNVNSVGSNPTPNTTFVQCGLWRTKGSQRIRGRSTAGLANATDGIANPVTAQAFWLRSLTGNGAPLKPESCGFDPHRSYQRRNRGRVADCVSLLTRRVSQPRRFESCRFRQ